MGVNWWYQIVARKLFRLANERSRTIDWLMSEANHLRANERHLVSVNKDLVQQLNETKRLWAKDVTSKGTDGNPCILSARERAASQRIRDLESEVERLERRKS